MIDKEDTIIRQDELILITGASGFIGSKVVEILVNQGFTNLWCFTRSQALSRSLNAVIESARNASIKIVRGNLLSPRDCALAVEGVKVIYHLAASTHETSFSEAYKHSVDTTRNLLEAALHNTQLKRFLNVSSFSVYSNVNLQPGTLINESCSVEGEPELRGEAYSYAKIKQEELVWAYGSQRGLPHVIVRPGAVYGPGNREITGRVGIARSGLLLHLGGANIIPFTYIDNCAEAIVMAGLKKGVDGEVFNVVDDGVMTSREFVKRYKRSVGNLRSIYLPKAISYSLFCVLGTIMAILRRGSLNKYNRRRWSAYWKGNTYTNEKIKSLLGWSPKVSMEEGMKRYFTYCKMVEEHDA